MVYLDAYVTIEVGCTDALGDRVKIYDGDDCMYFLQHVHSKTS